MLNRLRVFFVFFVLVIASNASAQLIGDTKKNDSAHKQPVIISEQQVNATTKTISVEASEVDILTEEELPPVKMTPEQKAEIDNAAKKRLRSGMRRQGVRDRREFIDALTYVEKIQKRRAAMLEGKSDREVAEAEASVKKPDINPAIDSQMELYLHQKAGLVDEE